MSYSLSVDFLLVSGILQLLTHIVGYVGNHTVWFSTAMHSDDISFEWE